MKIHSKVSAGWAALCRQKISKDRTTTLLNGKELEREGTPTVVDGGLTVPFDPNHLPDYPDSWSSEFYRE